MAIEDWMPELKRTMKGIEALRTVLTYLELPATIDQFPTMVILPSSGDQDYSMSGPALAHHRVQLTVYLATQANPKAYSYGPPLVRLVRDKLAGNVTLNGTVVHILPPAPPEAFYKGPGTITYGAVEYVGVAFWADVKEVEVVMVAA